MKGYLHLKNMHSQSSDHGVSRELQVLGLRREACQEIDLEVIPLEVFLHLPGYLLSSLLVL